VAPPPLIDPDAASVIDDLPTTTLPVTGGASRNGEA
jgi:hypothetical protein